MFEAQVLGLLHRYLGKYVYGLDAESLRISVWRGDVELTNLRLKPEALDDLNLPLTVKSGLLGRLTLKVCAVVCTPGKRGAGHLRRLWMLPVLPLHGMRDVPPLERMQRRPGRRKSACKQLPCTDCLCPFAIGA